MSEKIHVVCNISYKLETLGASIMSCLGYGRLPKLFAFHYSE